MNICQKKKKKEEGELDVQLINKASYFYLLNIFE